MDLVSRVFASNSTAFADGDNLLDQSLCSLGIVDHGYLELASEESCNLGQVHLPSLHRVLEDFLSWSAKAVEGVGSLYTLKSAIIATTVSKSSQREVR